MKKSKSSSVTFQDVSKVFGKSTVAVDNLSFKVESGKLVTLLGPSGCGKTTVLRMIAGLEMVSSGKILLNDEDITNLPTTDRDISMVFQSYALFPHLNIFHNVAYGLNFSKLSKEEIKEKVHEVLKLVGLEHLTERLPSQLSGGQQQRVAVARAIVLAPEVLLFDEPLSNLDVKLRRSVREEIRELQQQLGLTAVYVTHDQEEALAVSDLIVVMKNAKLAQIGTPQEIFQKPANCFIADFIGESNLVDCEVVSVDEQQVKVKISGKGYTIPAGIYRSGKAKVAIRPSHIQISHQNKGNAIPAKIVKVSYLGIRMEYIAHTDFGNVFIASSDMDQLFQSGEDAFIYIDEKKAVLVEDE